MAQKRFGVGRPHGGHFEIQDGGRFLGGTHPEMNHYPKSTSVPNLVLLYRFAQLFP
jgi:hypothetical protein